MALVDLLIILLLVGAGLFAWSERRRAERKSDAQPAGGAEAARLSEEVRELRARIHVLERALTDNHGSADLSSEIERLRDR